MGGSDVVSFRIRFRHWNQPLSLHDLHFIDAGPSIRPQVLGSLFLQHHLLNDLCGFVRIAAILDFLVAARRALLYSVAFCSGVVSLLSGGGWIVNFSFRDNEGRRFTIDLQLMHDDGLFSNGSSVATSASVARDF